MMFPVISLEPEELGNINQFDSKGFKTQELLNGVYPVHSNFKLLEGREDYSVSDCFPDEVEVSILQNSENMGGYGEREEVQEKGITFQVASQFWF